MDARDDRCSAGRSDGQVDRRAAEVAEQCAITESARCTAASECARWRSSCRPLPRFDPSLCPEHGVRSGDRISAHCQGLRELAFGREMTPVDQVSLFREPAQPSARRRKSGPSASSSHPRRVAILLSPASARADYPSIGPLGVEPIARIRAMNVTRLPRTTRLFLAGNTNFLDGRNRAGAAVPAHLPASGPGDRPPRSRSAPGRCGRRGPDCGAQ